MSNAAKTNSRALMRAKSNNNAQEEVCNMLVSSPLSKQNSASAEQRNELRNKAIDEIISSERAYQEQLEMLMQFFAQPLKMESIINAANYALLFGQIEIIQNLSAEFLRQVEQDKQHLALAFLKMSPFFKLYSVYAFDYRKALFLMQELQQKNAAFRKFLQQTETRPEVQRKLNSLMIAPIQRVPRYKLLLEKVLTYTSPAEPEHKILKESVRQIESIITHINNCVEDQEMTQQMLNIQNSLVEHTPNIVRPSRKVLLEGVLDEYRYRGVEKARYCVLFTDMFMYCKILKERPLNTLVEGSLQSICIFPLKKCNIYQLFSDKFKITCQGYGVILGSKDSECSSKWMEELQEAITKHRQSRDTLRKDSSKRRPVRKRELSSFDQEHVLPAKRKRSSSAAGKPNILDCFGKSSANAADTTNESPIKAAELVGLNGILKRKYPLGGENKENKNKHVKFTESIIEHENKQETFVNALKPAVNKSKNWLKRIYNNFKLLF